MRSPHESIQKTRISKICTPPGPSILISKDGHPTSSAASDRGFDKFADDSSQKKIGNRFGIERTNFGYPCLSYDLHVQEEGRTRKEIDDAFRKTLSIAKGIACLMKKHEIHKIILIPGKGRYVLKKKLHIMFEPSTGFCVRPMIDNAGAVVLKQIKK
ncbi:hypothetical protein B9Z55_026145 [Caenorhabditis nigoni]|uniref:Smr domain-containing protein n=1 Tax=Caenorhabditis nigoni TaxID=1611254 RepID=A0A2G5T295_9PELO|nr:hypothetical protein B9Z55_026145 [Caenorhabditis nigoni]